MIKKQNMPKGIAENSIQQIISMIVERGGGLIFTIILARLLQPTLFGIYSLTLSITLTLITLGNLGINEAMLRYVSLYYSKKQYDLANSYFVFLTKLKVYALTFVVLLLIVIAKPVSIFYNNSQLFFPIIICSLYLFLFSLSQFFSSAFYSLKNVKLFTYKETFFQIIRLCLVPLLILFSDSQKVNGIFLIIALASMFSLLFVTGILMKNYSFLFKRNLKKIDKKGLLKYILFLSIGSISGIFFVYIDTLILGYYVEPELLGFYRAAFTIVTSVSALITITGVFYPLFASLEGEELEVIFNRIFYFVSMFSIPLSLGISFISKPFIVALFGESYLPAAIPLIPLSFFIFTLTSGELFSVLLNSKGKSKVTAFSMSIATILNIVLNFVFIALFLRIASPIYATFGAALATVISRFCLMFILIYFFNKKMGFMPKFSNIFKLIFSGIIMVLFLYFFDKFFYGNLNLLLGIVEIIIAVLIYFSVLFLIKGVKKEDIDFIKNNILKDNFLK